MESGFKLCSAILGIMLVIVFLLPAQGADPSRWFCSAHQIKGNEPFSTVTVSSSLEARQEGPFRLLILITPAGKPEVILEDVFLLDGKKQIRLDYGIRLERDICGIVVVTKKKLPITSYSRQLKLYFLVGGKQRVVTADLFTYLVHL